MRKTLIRFCGEFPPQAVLPGTGQCRGIPAGNEQGSLQPRDRPGRDAPALAGQRQPGICPFPRIVRRQRPGQGNGLPAAHGGGQETFFRRLPPFGPDGQNLVDMLRSPAVAFPDSLSGQLHYIREKWGLLLGKYPRPSALRPGPDQEDEKRYLPRPGPGRGLRDRGCRRGRKHCRGGLAKGFRPTGNGCRAWS